MDLNKYIQSGIIELYVAGKTSPDESAEVELMAAQYPAVKMAMEEITTAIETYAQEFAKEPDHSLKPMLMAIIDYTERLQNGEAPGSPLPLHAASKISDYAEWLNRSDMTAPEKIDGIYAKIIGSTPEAMTAIVWITTMAPDEVHHDELEKFLIVEGSCDITIEDKVHHLVPGDMLAIPLYKTHSVKVTSSTACKIILQRAAA